jgi:hypothetical protein
MRYALIIGAILAVTLVACSKKEEAPPAAAEQPAPAAPAAEQPAPAEPAAPAAEGEQTEEQKQQ